MTNFGNVPDDSLGKAVLRRTATQRRIGIQSPLFSVQVFCIATRQAQHDTIEYGLYIYACVYHANVFIVSSTYLY